MPGESINFPITAEDRASAKFRDVGRSALAAAGKVDLAAAALDTWNDTAVKSKKATDTLIASKLAAAKAAGTLAKAEALASAEADKAAKLADANLSKDAFAALYGRGGRRGAGSAGKPGSGLLGILSALGGIPGGIAGGGGGIGGVLSGLLGTTGGGGAAAGAGGGIGAAGGAGIGAAALLAAGPIASLVQALAGFGIGVAGAGAAFGGVQKFNPAALAPGLTNIQKTLSSVFQSIGPSVGLMVASFGKFVQSQAPALAKFFASTLPFMRSFFTVLGAAGKQLIPAFTQALQQMVSSGALKAMTQGIVFLVQGLADFIKILGPGGMKAGAEIFRATALGIKGILIGLGATFRWLGTATEKTVSWMHNSWDSFRHDTANIFDGVRHDIAHYWGLIYNNTIGVVVRLDKDIIGWFDRLPGDILHALEGLGTSLYNFGHMALTKLWNGLKSVFTNVWSWFKSLPGKLLNAIGIHSPPDWAIQAGQHIMGGLLHGIISRKDELLSRFAAISSGMAGVAGRLTGPTTGVQALMQRIAGTYGWTGAQWNALNAVEMREAGYSLTATNPSSGAYGLAQFIKGPSEYYQWGGNPYTAAGQIVGMLNYIKSTYGSPAGAWQHELNYGWYDRGGILNPGLTLAYNATGRPEMVVPGSVGRFGATTVINVHVSVGHGTNPVQAAREIAEVLNAGARSGVRLRRSILSANG